MHQNPKKAKYIPADHPLQRLPTTCTPSASDMCHITEKDPLSYQKGRKKTKNKRTPNFYYNPQKCFFGPLQATEKKCFIVTLLAVCPKRKGNQFAPHRRVSPPQKSCFVSFRQPKPETSRSQSHTAPGGRRGFGVVAAKKQALSGSRGAGASSPRQP
jgi:hypothetical protein